MTYERPALLIHLHLHAISLSRAGERQRFFLLSEVPLKSASVMSLFDFFIFFFRLRRVFWSDFELLSRRLRLLRSSGGITQGTVFTLEFFTQP